MKIAIIGAGNMGSWLAKELSKENQVAVFDIDTTKMERLKGMDGISVMSDSSGISQFKPELLINAVTLHKTVEVFEAVGGNLNKDCIIADVASIKSDIQKYYSSAGFRFVSVHPMFGPTFANVEALENENAVLIRESDQEGAVIFRKLFQKLGVNIFEYTFEEHDKMMAYSLTLPFASTLVFAACMDANAVPGTTFRKHKIIAKGLLSEDDWLLSEILFNPHSLAQLEKVTNKIEFLKHVIKGRDYEEARGFFEKLRKNIGR